MARLPRWIARSLTIPWSWRPSLCASQRDQEIQRLRGDSDQQSSTVLRGRAALDRAPGPRSARPCAGAAQRSTVRRGRAALDRAPGPRSA